MNRLNLRYTPAASLLILSQFASFPDYASGFQISEISPSLQGDATAGAAAAQNDVTSLFINPATLATLNEHQAYIGGSAIIPHASMSGASAIHTVNVPGIPPSSISAPVAGLSAQNNISKTAYIPDAYFGLKIKDKLFAGIAVIAPYGLKTQYFYDSVVRYAAVYSSVKSLDINPALSYAFNDQLSFGAGLQAQYIQAEFSNFNGAYTGISAIDQLLAANHPTNVKGDGWGWGYNLGVLYKPGKNTRLGVGYRSQISTTLNGYGQQYTLPGVTVPAPSQNFLFNGQTTVRSAVTTPQILTLSAAHDIADWTVKASLQANFWNSFKAIEIYMPEAFATYTNLPTQWKNTWFGALGLEYRLNELWTFRTGTAYDQTPTVDEYRDPRIPDSDRVWFTLGATYKLSDAFSIDGAYAHIFMRDQNVNLIQPSGYNQMISDPLELNQVSAHYTGSADIVALALRCKFN